MALFAIIGFLIQLTPLILYFVFFKRINKIAGLRVVFFYVLASGVSIILMGTFKNYQLQIISIFEIIEFALFSTFYFFFIQSVKFKRFIVIVSSVNLILDLVLFFSQRLHFDFWATLSTAVIIVVYSIAFFTEQVNSPVILAIYQSYDFWIVVGCIVYIMGTFLLFLYTSDLKDKDNSPLWVINITFEIIKNICFSIGFLVAGNNNKHNILARNFDDTNLS